MAKVKDIGNGNYSFYCPGCEFEHVYWTNNPGRPEWQFNGDLNNPSFTPSLLNRSGKYVPGWKPHAEDWTQEQIDNASIQCHLYVTNGAINYCGDCSHAYSGKQGVEMKEYE